MPECPNCQSALFRIDDGDDENFAICQCGGECGKTFEVNLETNEVSEVEE